MKQMFNDLEVDPKPGESLVQARERKVREMIAAKKPVEFVPMDFGRKRNRMAVDVRGGFYDDSDSSQSIVKGGFYGN